MWAGSDTVGCALHVAGLQGLFVRERETDVTVGVYENGCKSGDLYIQGSTKLSPVLQTEHWIFELEQTGSNIKRESY